MKHIDMAVANFDGDRLPLPVGTAQNAPNSGLSGKEKVDCWLVVLGPGRYRLASREAISKILPQVEEIQSPGELLEATSNDREDATPARLISCTASPHGATWRLIFPKAARKLSQEGEKKNSFVLVVIVKGFVEFWFPDTLRRALSVPLSEVLSA
jgi:hypothetical protein